MKRGRRNRESWPRAKELAEAGCWLSEAARILKIHHTTAIYISLQMGFTWAKCPERTSRFNPVNPRNVWKPKPVQGVLLVSDEPIEHVDRLMRLARLA